MKLFRVIVNGIEDTRTSLKSSAATTATTAAAVLLQAAVVLVAALSDEIEWS